MTGRNLALLAAGAAAAIVLGLVSTALLAPPRGVPRPGPWAGPQTGGTRCAAPALPGTRVEVALTDMGSMMGGRRGGPMMGGPHGTMGVFAAPSTVRQGAVSFQAVNTGTQTHELVVLPLAAGQGAGGRPVGSDGRVEEAGSLGEASRTCGSGAGDGIAPGTAGWVTLNLRPGRYELICNLPGHYSAGMHTELDVTS